MREAGQAQVVADHRMRVDVVSSRVKKVLIVVANPSTFVRDGRLVTGQQQYSGRRVAQMVIEALGV
jgi:putative intracellular protease/amidase